MININDIILKAEKGTALKLLLMPYAPCAMPLLNDIR